MFPLIEFFGVIGICLFHVGVHVPVIVSAATLGFVSIYLVSFSSEW